jgi:hypothetical protein
MQTHFRLPRTTGIWRRQTVCLSTCLGSDCESLVRDLCAELEGLDEAAEPDPGAEVGFWPRHTTPSELVGRRARLLAIQPRGHSPQVNFGEFPP